MVTDEGSYWAPLCRVVHRFRAWVRVTTEVGDVLHEGPWGQQLSLPTGHHFQLADETVPLREIVWIDVSTKLVRGGTGGRPLQLVDIKRELVEQLAETDLAWSLRRSTWAIAGLLEQRDVEVLRIEALVGHW